MLPALTEAAIVKSEKSARFPDLIASVTLLFSRYCSIGLTFQLRRRDISENVPYNIDNDIKVVNVDAKKC